MKNVAYECSHYGDCISAAISNGSRPDDVAKQLVAGGFPSGTCESESDDEALMHGPQGSFADRIRTQDPPGEPQLAHWYSMLGIIEPLGNRR